MRGRRPSPATIVAMRRLEVSGLCLVAVFALTAVVAPGAQAGQIGRCVKAAKSGRKYTGKYSDKLCGTPESKGEGKYEWEATKVAIPFTSEGGATSLNSAAGEIACEHMTDKGEYLPGGVKGTNTLTFEGCQIKPFPPVCTSYGAAYGEIVTYELATKLVDHGEKGLSGEEPAAGEVWEQAEPKGTHNDPVFGEGQWLASFECDGIPFAISGSLSGVVEASYVNAKLKAGKPGKRGRPGHPTFRVPYTETGGEQDLQTTFANPENDDKVETGPSVLDFVNEVSINPIEKGTEVSGAV